MKLMIDIPDETFECLENMLNAECVDPYSLADIIVNKSIPIAPTVEQPTGEWYYNYQNGWHCSRCHESVKDMPTVMGKADFNFCPNCGAKMKRREEE